jgi:formylmethanofuran dehydrogenase subunit E
MQDAVRILLETPESELLRIRRVNLVIPNGDMPGMPKHRARCSRCNEMIVDSKEIAHEGNVLCGNCAGVPYYTDLA